MWKIIHEVLGERNVYGRFNLGSTVQLLTFARFMHFKFECMIILLWMKNEEIEPRKEVWYGGGGGGVAQF